MGVDEAIIVFPVLIIFGSLAFSFAVWAHDHPCTTYHKEVITIPSQVTYPWIAFAGTPGMEALALTPVEQPETRTERIVCDKRR